MQKILVAVIGIVIVVGTVAYFAKNRDAVVDNAPRDDRQTQAMPVPDAPATDERVVVNAPPPSADVVAVTVHGANYKFTPATISAKEGQTVRVTFTNGGGFHDFVIDEFAGAKTAQLQDGKSETIEFVADKKGAFAYYCSVGNHRAVGMEGKLIVE